MFKNKKLKFSFLNKFGCGSQAKHDANDHAQNGSTELTFHALTRRLVQFHGQNIPRGITFSEVR